MDTMSLLMLGIQVVFMGVMLFMLRTQIKLQQGKSVVMGTEMMRESEHFEKMKTISLTRPEVGRPHVS